MDLRTRISTIIAAIAYANVIFAQFDPAVLEGYPKLQMIYQVFSMVFAGAAWLNSHYFNQNFTPEGIMGTEHTRSLKREFKGE